MDSTVTGIEPLKALARKVLETDDPDAITPIGDGINGQSYLVEAAGRRCVIKRFDPDSSALVALDTQYALLERLAAASLAPKPIAVDEHDCLLATEYLADASPMTEAQVRDPWNITRIAGLLKRLHAVRVDLPDYVPEAYATEYFSHLPGDVLAPEEPRMMRELAELAQYYRGRFAPVAPCHNDLVAANILDGSEGLRLIDVEYAARAAPVLDLASLAAMNGFDAGEELQLVEAYHAPDPAPFSPLEFAKVRRLVSLLAHFWSRTREARSAAVVARYNVLEPKDE